MATQDEKKPKTIDIEIDGEKYEIRGTEHTLRELLELSGNDPATTYLIERHGHHETDYSDLDAVVRLHKNMKFVTGDRGPAPVA